MWDRGDAFDEGILRGTVHEHRHDIRHVFCDTNTPTLLRRCENKRSDIQTISNLKESQLISNT